MKRKMRHSFLACIVINSLLVYIYWTPLLSGLSPINIKAKFLRHPPETIQAQEKQNHSPYSEFQLLNDNMTYVYAGYYDDREEEGEVKVIAEIPRDIPHNFTCNVHYPDQTVVEVTGYVKYYIAHANPLLKTHRYRSGYIICPVYNKRGPPTSVTIERKGLMIPKTRVIVWPPPNKKNNLTRCVKAFIRNYDDASRLIWNIELFRMFGGDKHIIYLDNQTQRIVDVLESYASDGIVEIRNFSIPEPVTPLNLYMRKEHHWAQWSAYHDCLLSQMYSAKYVLFIDMDEMVVPRKHKTIVEMADDLFAQTEDDPKPAGSLTFRNVYYSTYQNMTRKKFPGKDLALKYNIHPLLYTTRFSYMNPHINSKTLVRPKTVDVMFIHYVEVFKRGWKEKIVDKDVATMHHYRDGRTKRMYPPETEDNYMLQFSDQLISAVKQRFQKVFISPTYSGVGYSHQYTSSSV